MTIDGERHVFTGWSVGVGNSKAYGGGMFAMPQAELDDGRLDVVTCAETSRLAFLRVLARVFKGTHLQLAQIETYRGEEITVDADRPFDIYADGDPVGRTPATMRVRARCLKVIVPSDVQGRPPDRPLRPGREPPPRAQRRHHRTRPPAPSPSPGALERMAVQLDEGAVLVSATNGKTTTSAMSRPRSSAPAAA